MLLSILVWLPLLTAPPSLNGSEEKRGTEPAANSIPRHYSHIRVASLGYAGLRFGQLENRLLRESLDVVVANPQFLKHVSQTAPHTPCLVYTNCSNIYEDLLLNWLAWADRQGVSREQAFYHAVSPTPFVGDSPSSRPVNWFWRVSVGREHQRDMTREARAGDRSQIHFPAPGESLYLGYPDRFAEVHVRIESAASGYSATWEYCQGSDANRADSWKRLTLVSDGTSGFQRSGVVRFNPGNDWKPCVIGGGDQLFYARCRCEGGSKAPVAGSILGRDYVNADSKRNRGTVPVFDAEADANKDGYLDDAEYANRARGKDARFAYESRLFTENYGPMRFATNVSDASCRRWLVDYHRQSLASHRDAAGFFMDNSNGKPHLKPRTSVEPITGYSKDYGRLLAEIGQAIAPHLLVPNTAGGDKAADEVIKEYPVYFEEFLIRPLSHNFNFFEETAALVARRAKLTTPAPLAFLDSHPQRGDRSKPDPLDARTQLATLAYYYLLAEPERTFLLFYAGYEPGTAWERHWCEAVAFDIGRAKGPWSRLDKGIDPSDKRREYRVYQREFERALVVYKPLAYQRGVYTPVAIGDETATTHTLPRTLRPLEANGKLAAEVTKISLRNGEAAILIKDDGNAKGAGER